MIGVVIGDIIGSRFEYLATQEKDVDFFHPACCFTDDTVCTAAISMATSHIKENIHLHQQLKEKYPVDYLKEFSQQDNSRIIHLYRKILKETAQKNAFIGYGKFFGQWVLDINSQPYYSLGNGSLMRVSPIVMASASLEQAQHLAYCASVITHNHPEALKVIQQYISILWMCKTWDGSVEDLKQSIRDYLTKEHIVIQTVEQYHQEKGFFVLAPDTFVRALAAFLEANSFEETIEHILYIGSDTDTTAAIAATFAEIAYGIPFEYLEHTLHYFNYTNLYLLQAILSQYVHISLEHIGSLFQANCFSSKHQSWYHATYQLVLEDPTAAWDPLEPLEESEYYSEIDKALLYERDNWFGRLLKKLGFRIYK